MPRAGPHATFRYPGGVSPIAATILLWIEYAGVPVGLYAFFHAVTQRSDAFTAADRMTKPAWTGITGGGTAAMVLFGPLSNGALLVLWIAGLVAVLVYIVDVKPKLIEVQRGGSGW